MEVERWKRIEELFNLADGRSPEEQLDILTRACGDDTAMLDEVVELLRSSEAAGSRFEDVVRKAGVEALAETPVQEEARPDGAGRRVGAYRLGKQIGSGGMGAVFEAERADDEFRKRVAVKLIKGGMVSGANLERFLRERQVLADIDHPNVARLIDGGTDEEGQPYLVMEQIEGRPFDRFCDEERLPVSERLLLFRQVCAAVCEAHKSLIVHRDIKPANILVTPDGTPKLLDFGIAKILEPGGDQTATQEQLLTPEFASPEQLQRKPITTSTDIYSLGVLLYHALTGRKPFESGTKPIHEVVRSICEEDPPPPSSAILQPADREGAPGPVEIARNRGCSVDKLRRRLAGDLDNIALTALHKTPERRYASVEQLSADVKRHLDGLPVMAHRDTFRYRAAKFIRRHRTAVMAAALILLALVAGLGFAGYGLFKAESALSRETQALSREKKARINASAEAERARIEAAAQRRVVDFLIEIFRSPEPSRTRGKTVTARDILKKGALSIKTSLEEDAGVRVRLMDVIGDAFVSLGLYSDAEPLFEQELELCLEQYGSDHRRTAEAYLNLSDLRKQQLQLDEAFSLGERGLEIARLVSKDEFLFFSCLHNLADVQKVKGNFDEAERLLEEAIAGYTRLLGEDHRHTLDLLCSKADFFKALGLYSKAEKIVERVLKTHRSSLGSDHPLALTAMNRLASLYMSQDRNSEAEELLLEAVDRCRTVLGVDHPDTLSTLSSLAILYVRLGRFSEAETLFETLHGNYSHQYDSFLNDMGGFHHYQGNLSEAERYYRQSLEMRRGELDEDHPKIIVSTQNLASVLNDLGDHEESFRLFEQALEMSRKKFDKNHPTTLKILFNMSDWYRSNKRLDEAAAVLEETLDGCMASLGEKHYLTNNCRKRLGIVRQDQGLFEEAESILKEAVDGASNGEDHGLTLTCFYRLGACYHAQRRFMDGARTFEQGFELGLRLVGSGDHDVISLLFNAVLFYQLAEDHENVRRLSDRFWEILKGTAPSDPEFAWLYCIYNSLNRSLLSDLDPQSEIKVIRAVRDAESDRSPECALAFRDDDGSAEDSACIDYGEDYLFKTIDVDAAPQSAAYYRLWIYGQPYSSEGKSFVPRADYGIIVNGDQERVLEIDVSEVFGPDRDAFKWVAVPIAAESVTQGDNRIVIFYTGPPNSRAPNKLRVGIDQDSDRDGSAWFANRSFGVNPDICSGELMIFLEARPR